MAESVHSCPKCKHVFSLYDLDLPPLPSTAAVLRDVLETNHSPVESQIPILQDFLSNGRARMLALNAKIALLRSSLDELLEEEDKLRVDIRKHEGGLSPLRRIPIEILSHIFTFTLPPHRLSYQRHDFAQWDVSAVCTRWRAIVISQPCFWTFIRYNPGLEVSHSPAQFEIHLRRSGQLPLDIEFSVEPWDFVDDEEKMFPEDKHVLQIVCAHAGRWETVSFTGPDTLLERLRCSVRDQLTHLRRLTLEIAYPDDDEDLPLDIFLDAPMLHTVSINRQTWSCPLAMVLPWTQLARYGGSNTWGGHLHALCGASNLIDCSLEIQGRSILTQAPIVLPRLLRLSLSDTRFLGCLETPALQELYCRCDAAPVISFLRSQACELQKLVLWWPFSERGHPTNMTSIVEAAPTITSLGVLFYPPLEFMRDFCSRPGMAPALEHLSSFPGNNFPGSSEEAQEQFMQAVETRRHGGRLKSVKVLGPKLLPNILGRMELLRAQGMKLATWKGPRNLVGPPYTPPQPGISQLAQHIPHAPEYPGPDLKSIVVKHQDSTAPRSSRFDAVNAEGESDEDPAILKSFSGDFRRLLEVL
ncbi:hypothetical protein DFH08DRAFT_943576 [Mycena albidolilacea]|uniref:F-box domain-containing protein n=1 Tax=Mycena albidolilacea TaxID=1033008 RepID=A0AAD6Z8V3_9AGAR|nr:hypothetical protein DFH08DRAFT_943576 [Mycena albidolilacea]